MKSFFYTKALTVMLVLCFITNGVNSQTVYSNKEYSRLSLFVGMTSSDLYNDTINYTSGIFFSGGFNYTIRLSEKMNIGIDLIYSGRAVKKDSPIIKYRYGYLAIPIYAQLKFSENLRANLGLEYAKFLNSQYSYIDGSKKNGMHIQSFRSNLDNDYGLLAGLEIDIKKDFTLAGRYTYSLKGITNSQSAYFGVFQLSFAYVLNRSHKQIFGKKEVE